VSVEQLRLPHPSEQDYSGLRYLQQFCYESADAKGFHEEGNFLRRTVKGASTDRTLRIHEANLRNYYANRLMLIAGEAIEAHEEIRKGHAVDHQYLNGTKPEGVPAELADILIRVLDFAADAGIDLASVVEEKLGYNATRERMHGKKF
jgi:NTP pyrophosphatase (non-canonical NTP hydrolase)